MEEKSTDQLRIETQSKLDSIQTLPSVPKVVFELRAALNNHNVSTNDIVKIISHDQGLITKILKIANSPLYGLQREVNSIEFAIVVLGLKEIQNLATALAFSSSLKTESSKQFNYKEYWMHSMVVGIGAKNITNDLGFPQLAADAFIGGILHDMGIQIIKKFFEDDYNEISEGLVSADLDSLTLEYAILGLNHGEIGRFLAEKWKLPVELGEIIEHHHYPSRSEKKLLPSIIHLADYMTQYFQIGSFSWDKHYKLDRDLLSVLEIESEEKLLTFIDGYRKLYEESVQRVSL